MAKLEYLASLGFTQVQLMPLTEHSDAWGYNPRQLLALHGAYGTPDDLRRFVSGISLIWATAPYKVLG